MTLDEYYDGITTDLDDPRDPFTTAIVVSGERVALEYGETSFAAVDGYLTCPACGHESHRLRYVPARYTPDGIVGAGCQGCEAEWPLEAR